MNIAMEPIGHVIAARKDAIDDDWGGTQTAIELSTGFDPDALLGLASFSHVGDSPWLSWMQSMGRRCSI